MKTLLEERALVWLGSVVAERERRKKWVIPEGRLVGWSSFFRFAEKIWNIIWIKDDVFGLAVEKIGGQNQKLTGNTELSRFEQKALWPSWSFQSLLCVHHLYLFSVCHSTSTFWFFTASASSKLWYSHGAFWGLSWLHLLLLHPSVLLLFSEVSKRISLAQQIAIVLVWEEVVRPGSCWFLASLSVGCPWICGLSLSSQLWPVIQNRFAQDRVSRLGAQGLVWLRGRHKTDVSLTHVPLFTWCALLVLWTSTERNCILRHSI